MPAGEVRDADIVDLAGAHEHIKRREHLFGRRECIEAMELEQVDIIGAEPAERSINGCKQMLARRTKVVRSVAETESCLGRDQHLVAAAFDGLAKNAFGFAERIDVRTVEHRHAGIKADVHQSPRFGRIGTAPRSEAADDLARSRSNSLS